MAISNIADGTEGAVTVGANTYELREWSIGREVEAIDMPDYNITVSDDDVAYADFLTGTGKGFVGLRGKQNLDKMPQAVFVPGQEVTVVLKMTAAKFWVVVCVPLTDDVVMNARDGDEYDATCRIRAITTVVY